jgi:hypothetical protein
MTTNWKIAGMKRLTENGLVIEATYVFNADEGNVLDRQVGSLTFSGNPEEPGFVPYSALTENIVLGWVYDSLGKQKTQIETDVTTRVTERYNQQQNNPYSNGLPWDGLNN